MVEGRRSVIVLLVASVLALLLGPVVILMGALSVNAGMIGGVLILLGAIGLYAGMKAFQQGT